MEPGQLPLVEHGGKRQHLEIATVRPSEICSASYTTPIPPRPTSRTMRKSPSAASGRIVVDEVVAIVDRLVAELGVMPNKIQTVETSDQLVRTSEYFEK